MNTSRGALIDRHIVKTAGSTVRTMLRRNAELGHCTYAGYDVSRTWPSRAGFTHMAFEDIDAALQRQGGMWCVEAHVVGPQFWMQVAQMRTHSRVVAFVRVREPYGWYMSYYAWNVIGRQRGGAARYGDNFSHWLQGAPNLQSRMILLGSPYGYGAQQMLGERLPAGSPVRLSSAQQRSLHAIVRSAELVAPLDRLDEALVVLQRLFPSLKFTAYRRMVPSANRGPWNKQPQRRVPSGNEVCAPPDGLAACRDAVARVAPDDFDLYRLVSERFERLLLSHDDDAFRIALRGQRAAVSKLAGYPRSKGAWRPGQRMGRESRAGHAHGRRAGGDASVGVPGRRAGARDRGASASSGHAGASSVPVRWAND